MGCSFHPVPRPLPFRYQFIRKMAVLEAVVEVKLSRLKTFSYLTIEPELIAPVGSPS